MYQISANVACASIYRGYEETVQFETDELVFLFVLFHYALDVKSAKCDFGGERYLKELREFLLLFTFFERLAGLGVVADVCRIHTKEVSLNDCQDFDIRSTLKDCMAPTIRTKISPITESAVHEASSVLFSSSARSVEFRPKITRTYDEASQPVVNNGKCAYLVEHAPHLVLRDPLLLCFGGLLKRGLEVLYKGLQAAEVVAFRDHDFPHDCVALLCDQMVNACC